MKENFKRIDEFMTSLNDILQSENHEYIDPIAVYDTIGHAQIIHPRKSNDRIVRQHGAFIVPAVGAARYSESDEERHDDEIEAVERSIQQLMVRRDKTSKRFGRAELRPLSANHRKLHENYEDSEVEKTYAPIVLEIKSAAKREMRQQLENLGFSQADMYPDVEHRSERFIQKFKNS